MSAAKRRLQVGVIGLGRLGRLYAQDLAARIPETRVVAVCDIDPLLVAEVADELGVRGRHSESADLVRNPEVEAVVIVTPTRAHREHSVLSLREGKPTFCEKPPALRASEAMEIGDTARTTGVLFQMGFMRRFDRGYQEARRLMTEGRIGRAVLYKSTSRDPYRPALAFADPRSSGGLLMDMGIHDFDIARFLMGEVRSVSTIGGVLAYPELGALGDIDNAVVSLTFESGALGVVDLSRSGIYGYDASTEVLGDAGTLRVGFLRETPLQVMTRNQVVHDTVPGFVNRFAEAFTRQLRDFALNVLHGRPASVTIEDGIEAIRISEAAQRALVSGQRIDLSSAAL